MLYEVITDPVDVIDRGVNPDWSRDGRYLVYQEYNSDTQADIRYLRFQTGGEAPESVTFLGTPANELVPKLSPDGIV